jgi:general secretion pathway protein D
VAGVQVPSFQQRTLTSRIRLRDGESNMLAGLLREDERRALSGFPGAIHVPILRQLFSSNDDTINQTDIVMLLTPHIIRTPEITEADLKPIYIGSQQNLGVGGPPPLIAAAPEPDTTAPPAAAAAPAPAPGQVIGTTPAGAPITIPPGSTPVPGTVVSPPAPAPATPATPSPPPPPAPQTPPTQAPPPDAAFTPPPAPAAATPTTTPSVGMAQIILSPPGTTFRVGAGPYTVPISISNSSRVSTIALTLTFDPAVVRVRTVQEGSFMRSGGVNAQFASNASSPGRVDITITRPGDATGASGTGLVGAVLFDPVAPGVTSLSISGAATGPGGTPMGMQFRPVSVTVQP